MIFSLLVAVTEDYGLILVTPLTHQQESLTSTMQLQMGKMQVLMFFVTENNMKYLIMLLFLTSCSSYVWVDVSDCKEEVENFKKCKEK